jgi:hypothetical protein
VTMDTVTATTIGNVAFLAFIAFVVWVILRPARTKPATAKLARELAELDAAIATARHEITLLRDDVGRLRGALGAGREEA